MTQNFKRGIIFLVIFMLCMAGIVKLKGDQYVIPAFGEDVMTNMGAGDYLLDDLMDQPGQGLPAKMKFQVLNDLGFVFTEEARERMEEMSNSGYSDFLASAGMGEFDYETGEWTSLSDQVYALDTEVFDESTMYPLFFQGLLSISGGEVPITDVVQDDSQVNWEEGTGLRRVTLNYDGKPYIIDTEAMMDWLDCSILKSVNDILAKEGASKRYYAMWNNFQGMTILFLSPEEARSFEGATGCHLSTALQ